MADWRQIQARIRKAKTSSEPVAQLAELYERTRDAMVAYELAAFQEKAGETTEAVRWYTVAAERFRRAQWRTKTEEALTRLGAPIPAPASIASSPAPVPITPVAEAALPEEATAQPNLFAEGQDETPGESNQPLEESSTVASPQAVAGSPASAPVGHNRRRRGRRGGRRHRGQRTGQVPAGSATPSGPMGATELSRPSLPPPLAFRPSVPAAEAASEPSPVRESTHVAATAPVWQGHQGHTRAGEPALASRMAQLESQLRRLLACPGGSLDDADQAPAGPGVLVLSDSDQQTHYYIEACQTLRIGIGNLLRGGRGSKDGGRLKISMAENLGIAEARVSKYLKDHCMVRWLQLDEGAPELAHFAIAVLRPVVNE